MKNKILNGLNKMIPNPVCELNYNNDYELLIATVLSAQSTDQRVNLVTKKLFNEFNLKSLSEANLNDIKAIIKPVGTFNKKSEYIKHIALKLIAECEGKVPNDRKYLESLPGVGRKTCNVVLSEIFKTPAIAVDTHVLRCSKRLGIALEQDDALEVENKLMILFPKKQWSRLHLQLVLFGRYICKSKSPLCDKCEFNNMCNFNKKIFK